MCVCVCLCVCVYVLYMRKIQMRHNIQHSLDSRVAFIDKGRVSVSVCMCVCVCVCRHACVCVRILFVYFYNIGCISKSSFLSVSFFFNILAFSQFEIECRGMHNNPAAIRVAPPM